MKLLGELLVDEVGQVLPTTFEFAAPIRGVTVHLVSNLADLVIVRSLQGFGTADELVARALVSGGAGYHAGGPVVGGKVEIEWQGTNDLKRARFCFWDEPVRSFGRLPIAAFSELGIAAAGDSADFVITYPGQWVSRTVLAWTGDQVFRADRLLQFGSLIPAAKFQGGSNVVNQLALFDQGVVVPDLSTFSFRNTGAVAGDVSAVFYGYLAAA